MIRFIPARIRCMNNSFEISVLCPRWNLPVFRVALSSLSRLRELQSRNNSSAIYSVRSFVRSFARAEFFLPLIGRDEEVVKNKIALRVPGDTRVARRLRGRVIPLVTEGAEFIKKICITRAPAPLFPIDIHIYTPSSLVTGAHTLYIYVYLYTTQHIHQVDRKTRPESVPLREFE